MVLKSGLCLVISVVKPEKSKKKLRQLTVMMKNQKKLAQSEHHQVLLSNQNQKNQRMNGYKWAHVGMMTEIKLGTLLRHKTGMLDGAKENLLVSIQWMTKMVHGGKLSLVLESQSLRFKFWTEVIAVVDAWKEQRYSLEIHSVELLKMPLKVLGFL